MTATSPALSVRALTPADAPAYVELRRAMLVEAPLAFSASPGHDTVGDVAVVRERLAQPEWAIIGGFRGETLVAAAGVRREQFPKAAHLCSVWGVWVAPEARGHGLGEAIMRKVIETARLWSGVRAICLSSGAGQTAAIRLYEKVGFVAWGVEPEVLQYEGKYYDEVYLRLQL